MPELKTKANDADVDAFINAVAAPQRREDSRAVLAMMQKVTRRPPRMWGGSIVGFGSYGYRYASGREGQMLLTGFSPRKSALVLYIMPGFDRYDELLDQLGKYKTGRSCLYLNKLADVDQKVLARLVRASVTHMRKTHPCE